MCSCFSLLGCEVQAVEYLRLLSAVVICLYIVCFIHTFSSKFVQSFLETRCHIFVYLSFETIPMKILVVKHLSARKLGFRIFSVLPSCRMSSESRTTPALIFFPEVSDWLLVAQLNSTTLCEWSTSYLLTVWFLNLVVSISIVTFICSLTNVQTIVGNISWAL